MKTLERKPFSYWWVIIAMCFLMVFTCLGFCSGTKSLYLAAITEALELKRSLFAINDSCRYVTTAVVNLFFGALIVKFGPRKLVGVAFCALILSVLINSWATNVFHFYLGSCFLGIGLSWTTTTMVGYVVNQWCSEHRGTIMGFVLAANGLGGAVASQILSPLIYDEKNAFGYRNAYRLTALILLAVGILVVALLRDGPEGSSNANYTTHRKPKKPTWCGMSFAEAIRSPLFYRIAPCVFLTGMILQGITGIATAHMKDVGLDPAYVALVVSAHSLALAGFKFFTGILHDRIGLRKTMTICYIAGIVSFLLLGNLTHSLSGRIMAMTYGILSSLALPLETIMLPLITADLFGQKCYSRMLGIIVSVNTAGFALGAPIFNLVFDWCGTYAPGLYVAVALLVGILITVLHTLSSVESSRQKYEQGST